jgi:hypothetical protein
MGIAVSTFKLLCRALRETHGLGSNATALTLGRQNVLFDRETFVNILIENGYSSSPFGSSGSANVTDSELFAAIGFNVTDSVDVSDYEGASIRHDLNIPFDKSLGREYDLIFDGGTAEHVFNLPVLLGSIHEICKENGIVIHSSPVNNWVDHGFYQFSPTLLTDYYRCNGWEVLSNYVTIQRYEHWRPWTIFPYSPGCVDYISAGGGGGALYGQWLVVRKTKTSKSMIIPNQSRYAQVWEGNVEYHINRRRFGRQTTKRIKELLRRHPKLREFIHFFYVRIILRRRRVRGTKV